MCDGLALHGLLHVKHGFTVTHLSQHTVREAELAVRTSPNAEVVAKLPVVQVVGTPVPRLGISRDFVALQARGCGQLGDAVHHFVGQIVFGQSGRELGKHRVGLDRQVVDRDVRRRKGQSSLDILGQAL